MSLLGGAVVPLEVALVRIFSFTIWHHFAFMVLSVALLGFAVSGTLLRLLPTLGTPPRARASLYAILFAGSAFVALLVVARASFDPTRIAEDPAEIGYLLLHYVALLVPFTFAGPAGVTLLRSFPQIAGSL